MNYSMRFMVDVVDGSMEPTLCEGDIAFVASGFEAENEKVAAVLITDDDEKTSKLYIRKVIYETPDRFILKATNPEYPSFVFEGAARNKVRQLGVVYQMGRSFGGAGWHRKYTIATGNRAAFEFKHGNIIGEPFEE